MYRCHFITVMLCFEFYIESSLQQCPQTSEKSVRVNRGENAKADFTIQGWSGELLIVRPGMRTEEICRPTNGDSWSKEINSQIRVRVFKRTGRPIVSFRLQMIISQANYSNDGKYHFVHQISPNLSCSIVQVTVIIIETKPVCTTFLSSKMESVKLCCEWVPREPGDKIKLMAKDQTLQLYEFGQPARSSNAKTICKTTTVISAMNSIHDAFDINRIPDACTVSNSENDYEDQCSFSVVMPKNINKINEQYTEVLYTCCKESNVVPSIWLYDKDIKLISINSTGESFRLAVNTLSRRNGDGKRSFVLICGEEKDDGRLLLFGFGELVLNFDYDIGVSLSGKIRPSSPSSLQTNNETTCTNTYISARAEPLIKNTSNTETGEGNPNYGVITRRLQTKLDNLITWNSLLVTAFVISFCFNIAVCVRKGYTKISSSKKKATAEQSPNTTSLNPQVGTTSDNTSGDETIQMTSVPSSLSRLKELRGSSLRTDINKTVCPHNISSSRKFGGRSKLSGEWKQERTILERDVCSESLAASCQEKNNFRHGELPGEDDSSLVIYQTIGESKSSPVIYSTTDEGKPASYQTLDGDESSHVIYQTLSEDKSSPGVYQTLNDDMSTSASYHTYDDDIGAKNKGSNIYSSVDDGQAISEEDENIQSTEFVKANSDVANGDTLLQPKCEYVNSDILPDNQDCVYAMPDKPPTSETTTVGDLHSARCAASRTFMTSSSAVSDPSTSEYDCLRRPEIEQNSQ